jgi:hypothetical protein
LHSGSFRRRLGDHLRADSGSLDIKIFILAADGDEPLPNVRPIRIRTTTSAHRHLLDGLQRLLAGIAVPGQNVRVDEGLHRPDLERVVELGKASTRCSWR